MNLKFGIMKRRMLTLFRVHARPGEPGEPGGMSLFWKSQGEAGEVMEKI